MRGLHPEPRARRAGRVGDRQPDARAHARASPSRPRPPSRRSSSTWSSRATSSRRSPSGTRRPSPASATGTAPGTRRSIPTSAGFAPDTIRVGWKLRIHPGPDDRHRLRGPDPDPAARVARGLTRRLAGRLPVGLTAEAYELEAAGPDDPLEELLGPFLLRGSGRSGPAGPPRGSGRRRGSRPATAMSRAKPISWVAMTIVMPLAASPRMTSSTSATSSGSRAEVTSSRSRTSGCIARARMIATRCC